MRKTAIIVVWIIIVIGLIPFFLLFRSHPSLQSSNDHKDQLQKPVITITSDIPHLSVVSYDADSIANGLDAINYFGSHTIFYVTPDNKQQRVSVHILNIHFSNNPPVQSLTTKVGNNLETVRYSPLYTQTYTFQTQTQDLIIYLAPRMLQNKDAVSIAKAYWTATLNVLWILANPNPGSYTNANIARVHTQDQFYKLMDTTKIYMVQK